MSAQTTIDSLTFATAGERLAGNFRAEDLPRLLGSLTPEDVAVQYLIEGCVESSRPVLRLAVQAKVWLICQRCLEPYLEEMEVASVMAVARNESELALWESEDPLLDVLVNESRLDVATLVEDEIFLGLPIVPRHPEGQCGAEF